LGSKTRSAKINISDAHVLSSMSKRWKEATPKSGRFDQYSWNKTEKVFVSTVDEKIKTYGTPQFIKIDVGRYEIEVLQGLTNQNFNSKIFIIESDKLEIGESNNLKYLYNYIPVISNGINTFYVNNKEKKSKFHMNYLWGFIE